MWICSERMGCVEPSCRMLLQGVNADLVVFIGTENWKMVGTSNTPGFVIQRLVGIEIGIELCTSYVLSTPY